jgi:hypothetical protein
MNAESFEETLAAIEEIGTGEFRDEPLAFGVMDTFAEDWEQLCARVEETTRAICRAVAHYAWVETAAGTTVVSYGGNVGSAYAAGLKSDAAAAHMRALSAALDQRARLARLAIATLRAISAILTALANPLSAVAAGRATWQLLEQLYRMQLVPDAREAP